jgi:predicted secreted protein
VAEVSEESKLPLSFILMGSEFETGASAASLKTSVQRFEILAYTRNPREVRNRTRNALKVIGDGERLVVGLQAYQPAVTGKENLVALVEAVKDAGAKNLSFYHYGIMPPDHLDWVKEAIASWRR